MSRDDSAILDIRDAATRAIGFAQGMSIEEFVADEMTHWAVYSQIVLIGEAANRVSSEYRQPRPEVPWKQMIGMRHRLVHGYDDINWERVWETVTDDLPRLLASLAPFLPREEESN